MLVRRCLAIVLAFVVPASTFVVMPARAQTKKKTLKETLPAAAQAQWDTAVGFSNRGKWSEARAGFYAAYEASKNPRVLFNVAVCEKNNTQYARAVETFKRELAEGKTFAQPLAADEEAEVRAQIEGLEKFIANLTIDVSEPGADIFVDGDRVGTSPLAGPISVPLGERRVHVTKAGFGEANETVDLVGGGTAKLAIKLSPNIKTALVHVLVTGASNADVLVDGQLRGPAPYNGQVTVSSEPHQFTAQAPGYVSSTSPALVREGSEMTVTIGLSPDQQKGKLIVATKPEGATIEIDGQVRGASRWEGAVFAGSHQIVVKKQGFYPWSYDVEVLKGSERAVTASLNEDRNTSFVPWLIGTVLVVGASATAIYFVTKPKDQEKVNGTLAPFTVGTPSLRWH